MNAFIHSKGKVHYFPPPCQHTEACTKCLACFRQHIKTCSQEKYAVFSIQIPLEVWWQGANRSISQIPWCTCSISHNAAFRTEMCTFLFWMLHCGIWNSCIMGFVNWVNLHCKYIISGSGNGLVQVLRRRQAITWTNDNPVHWHLYASSGLIVSVYSAAKENQVQSMHTHRFYHL